MNVWRSKKELYICYVNNGKQTHNDMTFSSHVTSNEKKGIQTIINGGYVGQDCKIGRTSYRVIETATGYTVKIGKQTRGMGFYGEPLRFEVRTIQVGC